MGSGRMMNFWEMIVGMIAEKRYRGYFHFKKTDGENGETTEMEEEIKQEKQQLRNWLNTFLAHAYRSKDVQDGSDNKNDEIVEIVF
jgi:quinolinate synthase